MKVEIDDGAQTAIDIGVGNSLLIGTVLDFMCDAGIIDRSDLVSLLARRAAFLSQEGCEGHLLPFVTAQTALDDRHEAVQAPPALRVVWDREAEGVCHARHHLTARSMTRPTARNREADNE